MYVKVLGPLEVTGAAEHVRRSSHRRLLSILALHAAEPIDVDRLIDRFWRGDPPATARAAIQTHISALRGMLGRDAIVLTSDGYRLEGGISSVDAHRVGALWTAAVRAVRGGDWTTVEAVSSEALGMWRGGPYLDLADDIFAQGERARLKEMYVELHEHRAHALLELGRPTEALPDLEFMVVQEPERERLWELLMTARYRLGRHADAVRAFTEASERLAEVGLEPSETLRRLENRILLHDRTLSPTPHNLPRSLDSFVGRGHDTREVTQLAADNRLVTLTGPGGSGKTRLAIEVAKGLFASHPNGVWLVRLDAIDRPELILTEIASVLGTRPATQKPTDAIVQALSRGPTLLILDNCEHVRLAAARTISDVLTRTDDVTILATSREPLRVPGEVMFEVGGLPTGSTAAAGRGSATDLFIDRAKQADPGFVAGAEERSRIEQICTRLDGLPLAIELAAARTSSLGLETISERLDDLLQFLTEGAATAPERQRTIEATIEWSYDLLGPSERSVLEFLSVFRGGFTLNAAESVVAAFHLGTSALETVPALVDKSLVVAEGRTGTNRYRLLEPIRQFAWGRLSDRNLLDDARTHHARWAASQGDDVWRRSLTGDRAALLTELASEADNLESALQWAQSSAPDIAPRLASMLAWHWLETAHMANAVDVAHVGLTFAEDGDERLSLMAILAMSLAYSEDIPGALLWAREAYSSFGDATDDLTRAWVLQVMQLCLFMSVESDPAEMLGPAGLASEVLESSTDRHARILLGEVVADGLCWNGHLDEGLAHQRQVLDLVDDDLDADTASHSIGHAVYNYMLHPVLRRTEPARIVTAWAESEVGDLDLASQAQDWMPWIQLQLGDFASAADMLRLLGDRRQEGYNRTIYLIVKATVAWMQGDLRGARKAVSLISQDPINERWWHVFYPLAAEVAVDLKQLPEVERLADAYLSRRVHPTREAAKLGVLMPLVRGYVDAALADPTTEAAANAAGTFTSMQRILDRYPPLVDGATAVMTPTQNMLFAEAEVSRLDMSNPDLWQAAASAADYAYYSAYAEWRRAEALVDVDQVAATDLLQTLARTAARVGASALRRNAVRTARRSGIQLILNEPQDHAV